MDLYELFTEHLEDLYINNRGSYADYEDFRRDIWDDRLWAQYEEFVEDYLQCFKDSLK